MTGKKYRQSAGYAREVVAAMVFAAGFAVYDAQHGGDGARLVSLLMMLGSAFFLCCAIVERLFFFPRLRRRGDPADHVSMPDAPKHDRNEGINYEGPRVPRAFAQDPHHGPDGLDPVRPPEQYYAPDDEGESGAGLGVAAESGVESGGESGAESEAEDERVFHEEMKTTLTDPFFSGDNAGGKTEGTGGRK